MVDFFYSLQRSAKTLKALGLRSGSAVIGAKLLLKINRSNRWAVRSLSIRGLPKPVFVRLGTSDVHVLQQVFTHREYEDPSRTHSSAINEFYCQSLEQGKTPIIVDCGANIGLASIWYANIYPHAKIFSVEPEPKNFEILRMNASHYPNVIPVQAGVSDQKRHLHLTNVGNAPWAWETVEDEAGEVETVTISDLLACEPDGVPLIVKIDIEGFEINLFQSNISWVDQTPVIVFESHDWLFPWRGTAHAIFSALVGQRRRDYLQHGENTFSYSHNLLQPAPPSTMQLKEVSI